MLVLLSALSAAVLAQSGPSQPAEPTAVAAANQKDSVSIAIVVDKSVHDWNTAGAVQNSVKQFLRSLREEDEYAIFSAAGNSRMTQEFTNDPGLVPAALKRANTGGKNAFYDALLAAVKYLGSNATNDRKALLALSTGEDGGSRARLNDVISAAKQAGVPVYSIAMQKGTWRSYDELQRLAQGTGGAAYFPRGKSELAEVNEVAARRLMGPPLDNARAQEHKPLARYSEIIVRSIPVAKSEDTDQFQPADSLVLERMVLSRLKDKKLFARVIDATGTVGDDDLSAPLQAGSAAGRVELLGTIVGYRPGSRLKRGTAGLLGSGTTHLKVQFVFRDAATRKPVFSFMKEASGSSGLLAGNNTENEIQAMTRVVNALVQNIEHNR